MAKTEHFNNDNLCVNRWKRKKGFHESFYVPREDMSKHRSIYGTVQWKLINKNRLGRSKVATLQRLRCKSLQ